MSDNQNQSEPLPRKAKVSLIKTLLQALLLIALVASGWFFRGMITGGRPAGPPPGGPSGLRKPPGVVVETVREASAQPPREYIGHVEAIQSVDVRAQVCGYLDTVHFKEGSLVSEGDLLFTIQQDQYKAHVALSEAALAQAKADLEGAKADLDATRATLDSSKANLARAEKYLTRLKNADGRSIVQADLDTAQSDYLQATAQVKSCRAQIELKKTRIVQIEAAIQEAKANLDLARINLGYTEIRSPITGQIGKAVVTKGNYVAPGTGPLTRIVQLDPIRVHFSMSDREYLNTIEGQAESKQSSFKMQVCLPNGNTYKEMGKWDYKDNEMDPATGTIAIWAVFDNPDGLLMPKTYTTVMMETDHGPTVPVVPQEAIMIDDQGSYVYVVNGDETVEARRVELGLTAHGEQRVHSGISAGEKVVTIGIQKVRPGQKVNVRLLEGKAGEPS